MSEEKMSAVRKMMVGHGRTTARSASFILISKILSFVINGIGLILIARILAPSAYGIYVVAMAVAGFFGAFGDFGIGQAMTKMSAEHLAKKDLTGASEVVGSALPLLIVLPGIFAIAAFLLSGPVAQYVLKNPSYTFALQVAAITVVSTVLYWAFYSALIGFGKVKRLAQMTFVQAGLQASISVGLALLGFGALAPIYGIVISYLTGFAISFAVLVIECGVRPRFSVLDMSKIGKIFNFSIPLGIATAAHTLVMNIAVIILGIVAATQVVGNFGIAVRVGGTFDIIVGTVGLSLLPLFSATLARKLSRKTLSSYFNYSLYIAFLFIAPVVFYIVALARQFTYTLFGGVYSLAPQYVAVMALGILFSVSSTYATTLLVGAGDTKRILKYGVAVELVSILLILPFLLVLGGTGLSLIVFIIEPIVANLLYLRILKQKLGLTIRMNKLFRVVAAALISGIFIVPLALAFGSYYIQVLIAAAIEQIVLYPMIVALVGGVTQKDIVDLRLVSNELPGIGRIVDVLCAYMGLFARKSVAA